MVELTKKYQYKKVESSILNQIEELLTHFTGVFETENGFLTFSDLKNVLNSTG